MANKKVKAPANPAIGTIYVLTVNNNTGKPKTTLVYDENIVAPKGTDGVIWNISNQSGRSVIVTLDKFTNILKPNPNPFGNKNDAFTTPKIGNGTTYPLALPFRPAVDNGGRSYRISSMDAITGKVLATNRKNGPFSAVTVDPELDIEL